LLLKKFRKIAGLQTQLKAKYPQVAWWNLINQTHSIILPSDKAKLFQRSIFFHGPIYLP
jgi:outer membrane phospholipase A